MKPRSRKNKGREFQNYVRDTLLENFDLQQDDIRGASMGAPGEDIQLSPAAREKIPFSFECKRQERFSIYSAIDQSIYNSREHIPAVIFRKNYMNPWIAMPYLEYLQLFDIDNITPTLELKKKRLNIYNAIDQAVLLDPEDTTIIFYTVETNKWIAFEFDKFIKKLKNICTNHKKQL